MEQQYGRTGPEFEKYDDAPNRVFFRGRTSVAMLREMARNSQVREAPLIDMYADGGCSESCELYETIIEGDSQ